MDNLSLNGLFAGVANVLTDSLIVVDYGAGDRDHFIGMFDYAAPDVLTGGVLVQIQEFEGGALSFDINRLNVPLTTVLGLLEEGGAALALSFIFVGADRFKGSASDDLLRSFGGADSVAAGGGNDTVFGGDGNDTIDGGSGASYLRGDGGDDIILGGSGNDDLNGNAGNDVLYARAGNDWVLGGKGNDDLLGEDGDDLVYGNLGDDTLTGGAGADLMRGGQGNDFIGGGFGDDWLSGDLGFDVLSGGLGADTFYVFAGAGPDRITDFRVAEGDRVQVALGTPFEVFQLGADTVVRLGPTDQLLLVGVQLATLPAGWIFSA